MMKGLWFLSFPIAWGIIFVSFCIYLMQEQNKKTDFINDMALLGNPAAISIVRKYEKPYQLEFRVVKQAIEGNVCAQRMLKLEEE